MVTSVPPPTSDMMIAFCPWGPTRRMSMSSGKVWLMLVSITVTFCTVPWPATFMFDGYGVAVPLVPEAGMVIVVELVKLTGVQLGVAVGVPVGVGVAVAVAVAVGVGVKVAVAVGVGGTVAVGVAVTVGVGLAVGVGEGAKTPLTATSSIANPP